MNTMPSDTVESVVILRQSSLIAACVRIGADLRMHALLNVIENAIKQFGKLADRNSLCGPTYCAI